MSDERLSPSNARPLADLIEAVISRRTLLGGMAAGAVSLGVGSWAARLAQARPVESTLQFTSVERKLGEAHAVAEGYQAQVLLRWGDPVLADAPAWNPRGKPSPQAQAMQFGFNCDYNAFLPLPRGSDRSDHGLLWTNHEYTDADYLFPDYHLRPPTPEHTQVAIAAHGGSVTELRRVDGSWQVVSGSKYARRITGTTEMEVRGPAAGHARLKTKADPSGAKVLGMFCNCGGGKTPWGTILTCEENFNGIFGGELAPDGPEAANHDRYGVTGRGYFDWNETQDRFDLGKEPNEPNRFGWVVEIDPYEPTRAPIKRTALGRFKHEAATTTLAPDGRVVVYSGDDEQFEYLYRFVSEGRYDPEDREANRHLLDAGTLSVAKFDESSLSWLPLVHGQGPLTAENGFASQADVLIEVRRAADLLGATPLDRPEDVETNPVNGRTYVMLTNNTRRKADQVDGPNPRAKNWHGHVVELIPPGETPDHSAETYTWAIVLLGGDPKRHEGARYHPESEAWLTCPDNCAFDPKGRLWIATDQGSKQARNGVPDGLFACDLEGEGRALVKCLFAGPRGAEITGPEFTPDGTTVFVSVQHPGEERNSDFDKPSTRWPDFDETLPPRPSVVAITREGGGPIGG